MDILSIISVYLVCHSPAIVMLAIGLRRLKTKPTSAKVLLIISGMYFLIGAGICGTLLSDWG